MRYRVKLSKQMKNNFIRLPANSPLRNSMPNNVMSISDSSRSTPVRIQTLAHDLSYFFGFTGGTSEEPNTVEISFEVGRLLDIEEGDMVNAAIEYSFERLNQIELDPLTADDFEIIEKNSEFIEEQLLNQVGVFYDKQLFVIFLQQASVRLQSKVKKGKSGAKCFYLTDSSELHVAPKTRQKKPSPAENPEQISEKAVNTQSQATEQQPQGTPLKLTDTRSKDNEHFDTIYLAQSQMNNFKEQEIIRIRVPERSPTIDLEFNDFLSLKSQNHTIGPLNATDLYLKVQYKDNLQNNEARVSHSNLTLKLKPIENVELFKVAEANQQQQQKFIAAFSTNIDIIKTTIKSNSSIKDNLFIVINDLLRRHLAHIISSDQSIVINQGSIFCIEKTELRELLEHLEYEEQQQLALIAQKVAQATREKGNGLIEFRFQHDNSSERPLRMDQLVTPKYMVITKQTLTTNCFQLAFDPLQQQEYKAQGDPTGQALAQKIYDINVFQNIERNLFEATTSQPVLLYGPEGVGKTHSLIKILQKRFQDKYLAYICYIDCNKISSHITSADQVDAAIDYVQQLYDFAEQMKPSLFVLDNINALCPLISNDEQLNVVEAVKTEKMTSFLTELVERQEVSFVAIGRHFSSVNPKLFDVGLFDTMIDMQPPTKEQRYQVIKQMIAPESYQKKEIFLQKLAQMTEYFLVKDLAHVFKGIDEQMDGNDQQFEQVAEEIITKYKAMAFPLMQNLGEGVPDWDTEIGGLMEAKERIEEIFGVTQRYSLFFKGQKVNQGLLLYGPPGCGKTYIAGSIAKKFNINFISVKGPELLNKYIGASEQNVRELFERAQASKPTILFFDEFDSLVPKRGSGQTVVTDRIVNQFLVYLDGVEGRDGVFVMAATSRPDMVDVALLRPGRIDKSVYCGFPEFQERVEILSVYLKKFNFVPKQPEQFAQFLEEMAHKTLNFTSADMKGLVQNAQLGKMSNLLKVNLDGQEPDFSINEDDIRENLLTFVKGINEGERKRFLGIYAKYQDKGGKQAEQVREQKQILH